MNEKFFSENVYGYAKRISFFISAIEKYRKENSFLSREINILEIGCGTGIYISITLAVEGYSVIGIDPDQVSIKYASLLCEKQKIINIKFYTSSLDTYTQDKKFDIVILSEVLEHISDPSLFLKKAKSFLKENGLMLITVPNGSGWFEYESALFNKKILGAPFRLLPRIPYVITRPDPPGTCAKDDIHVQHFSLNMLKELFNLVKLEIINKTGSTLFAGPISQIFFWRFKPILLLNTKLGDMIPMKYTAGWYFVLKKIDR